MADDEKTIEASIKPYPFVVSRHDFTRNMSVGEGTEKDSEGTESGGEGSEGGGNG